SVLGTVRYMSPEQACGGQVDKRTDIWSLGVVLYEMATGHAPFTGDTPREAMSSILEKEPPPLANYVARTPAELQQIISKTLRKDKENAFFADGVQDELLSNLSKIKDLKVISRTSVMQDKSGTKRNLKDIAQQLGVSNVVEGSVRRSGDHVRVSVQLIDARTD